MKEFREVEVDLTQKGSAVLSPIFFEQMSSSEISEKEIQLYKQLHLKKIDLSDEIFVIDVDGYIGESTKNEIKYAKLNNKSIKYYSIEKNLS